MQVTDGTDNQPEKLFYTPLEFARLFNKRDRTWTYRQLWAGTIEAITGYGHVMIPASEKEKILAKRARYVGKKRHKREGDSHQP